MAFKLVVQVAPLAGLACLAFILASSSVSLALLATSGLFIGKVPAAISEGLSSEAGSDLVRTLVVLSILFLASMVLPAFQSVITESLGRKVDARLRARLMTAVLAPVGIAHLERPEVSDQISIADGVGPGDWKPGDAVVGVMDNIGTRVVVLAAAAFVSIHIWWAGILLVLGGFILRSRFVTEGSKRLRVLIGEAQEMRRADYMRDLALRPEASKEIRVFGLADWVHDQFATHWLNVMGTLWTNRKSEAGNVLIWFGPIAIATGLALHSAGNLAIDGDVNLSTLALLILAVLASGNWTVTNSDLLVEYGTAAVKPALELEKAARVEWEAGRHASVDTGKMPSQQIEFRGVAFTYEARPVSALSKLDLVIPAGKSLAIVGENGAGKTTLVKLLARLHEPTAGSILIDGLDLQDMHPMAWRRRIAVIFQDFLRFELSVKDNVGFGALALLGDPEALSRAAQMAGAQEVIDALPDKWDTILSRQYEGGADISGGQWQRIALARAMLAVQNGATLLILDEPTANLDVKAEAALFDNFLDMTKGLTTILISHRFSSVRRADRICVLAEGRVVESGTHDDLMDLGQRYAEAFTLQASRFREAEPQ